MEKELIKSPDITTCAIIIKRMRAHVCVCQKTGELLYQLYQSPVLLCAAQPHLYTAQVNLYYTQAHLYDVQA